MKKEVYDTVDSKLLKSFEIIKKLGQGTDGQVWKAKNKKTGNVCALKKIFDAFRNASEAQKTYREIKYLQKIDHPSILKLYSYHHSSNQNQIYLELELMEADLSLALKNSVLKTIHKHYIFYQLANALKYLHSAQLVHRDIKPVNILVNQTCDVKLCDFGLTRSVARDPSSPRINMTENVVTRWYRAPEILLGYNSYGKPVDIWSIGCVLAQMILGRPLFQGTSAISQLQKILEVTGIPSQQDLQFLKNETTIKAIKAMQIKQIKTLKSILNTDDANLIDLLEQIFQINPFKRPTADKILLHPFVTKFRGRIQEKIALQPIKILYESKLLSPEDYKSLISCELEQQDKQTKLLKKSSKDSSPQDPRSLIFKTMPQMTRDNFFKCVPIENEDKNQKQFDYHNVKGFSPFGAKKDISPLRNMGRQNKSPSEKRSPSFLQKKKQQTESKVTPEKVQSPKEDTDRKEQHKKTNIKRTLTFPLRISPGRQKNQQTLTNKITHANSNPSEEQCFEKDKNGSDKLQEKLKQHEKDYHFFAVRLSPGKGAKPNIFASIGLERVERVNMLEKKPSLTQLPEQSAHLGFPIQPTKLSPFKTTTAITSTKIECPQAFQKNQTLPRSPINKTMMFRAVPQRTSSPHSRTPNSNVTYFSSTLHQ